MVLQALLKERYATQTKGRTEVRTRWLVKFSQDSLWFANMSFDVDVVHPMYPSLGKVNFGVGKIASWSVTVTTEAGRTS